MAETPLLRGAPSRTASRKKQERQSGNAAPDAPVTGTEHSLRDQFEDHAGSTDTDDNYERLPCDTSSICSDLSQPWQYANPQITEEQLTPQTTTTTVQRSASAVKHRPPVPTPLRLPSQGKYEHLVHAVANSAPETDEKTSAYEPINIRNKSATTEPVPRPRQPPARSSSKTTPPTSTVGSATESRDTRPAADVIPSDGTRESDAAAAAADIDGYCDVRASKTTTDSVARATVDAAAAATRLHHEDTSDYRLYEYLHCGQSGLANDWWMVDSTYDDLGDLESTFHFRQSSRHFSGGTCSTFNRMGSFMQLKRNVLRQSNLYCGVGRSPSVLHPSQLYEPLHEVKNKPRDADTTLKQANVQIVVLVRLILGGCHALVDVLVLVGCDVSKMDSERRTYRSQGYALGTSTECQLPKSEGELLQVELKVTDWMQDANLIGRSTFELPVEALWKGGIQPCAFGIKSRDAVKSPETFNSIFVCEIIGRQTDATVMTVGLNCDLHKCKTPGLQHVFRNCTCDDCDDKRQQTKRRNNTNNNNNNNSNNRLRQIPSHARTKSAPMMSQPQRLQSIYLSAPSSIQNRSNVHDSNDCFVSLHSEGPDTVSARRRAARNANVDAPDEMESSVDAGPPGKAWFDEGYCRDGLPVYYV